MKFPLAEDELRDHLERIYACIEDCRGALVEIVSHYPVPSAHPELRSIFDALAEAHKRLNGPPPPRPASSDGPMQRCFSCSNWVPVSGPAQCVVCRPSAVVDDPYGHEEDE